jgi:hypothetical protein
MRIKRVKRKMAIDFKRRVFTFPYKFFFYPALTNPAITFKVRLIRECRNTLNLIRKSPRFI